MRRKQGRKRAGRAGARALVTLAALVALFLQAFVVQTHTHASALLGGGAFERIAERDAAHASAAHDQAGCVTCVAFAASGRAALPDAATLIAQHRSAYETATLSIRSAPQALAHSWRSRAPPLSL